MSLPIRCGSVPGRSGHLGHLADRSGYRFAIADPTGCLPVLAGGPESHSVNAARRCCLRLAGRFDCHLATVDCLGCFDCRPAAAGRSGSLAIAGRPGCRLATVDRLDCFAGLVADCGCHSSSRSPSVIAGETPRCPNRQPTCRRFAPDLGDVAAAGTNPKAGSCLRTCHFDRSGFRHVPVSSICSKPGRNTAIERPTLNLRLAAGGHPTC